MREDDLQEAEHAINQLTKERDCLKQVVKAMRARIDNQYKQIEALTAIIEKPNQYESND